MVLRVEPSRSPAAERYSAVLSVLLLATSCSRAGTSGRDFSLSLNPKDGDSSGAASPSTGATGSTTMASGDIDAGGGVDTAPCPQGCPYPSRCVPVSGGYDCICNAGYYGVVGACQPLNVVSTATNSSCALDNFGILECWGGGAPDAVVVSQFSQFVQASTSLYNGCAVESGGRVECWGLDAAMMPGQPQTGSIAVQVALGLHHGCLLNTDGRAECWGDNSLEQAPALASLPGDERLVYLAANDSETCGLTRFGTVRCWGNGVPSTQATSIVAQLGEFVQLDGGSNYSCAIRDDGAVECWGGNYGGRTVMTSQSGSPFVVVSAGDLDACATTQSGLLECWQSTTYDQPYAVADVNGVEYADVSVQDTHVCALTSNGGVVCAGYTFDPLGTLITAQSGAFFGRETTTTIR